VKSLLTGHTLPWIVQVRKDFTNSNSCVCDNKDKSAITSRLPNRVSRSLPVEGIDILRKRPVRLDCIMDSTVDVSGECVTRIIALNDDEDIKVRSMSGFT
jgi:hypothetical protein